MGFHCNQIGDYHGTAVGKGLEFTCSKDQGISDWLGKCWFIQPQVQQGFLPVCFLLTLGFDLLTPHLEMPACSTEWFLMWLLSRTSSSHCNSKNSCLCEQRSSEIFTWVDTLLWCASTRTGWADRLWQRFNPQSGIPADSWCDVRVLVHARTRWTIKQLCNHAARQYFSMHSFS